MQDNRKRWEKFVKTLKPSMKNTNTKQIKEYPAHIDCLCTMLGRRLIGTQETYKAVKMEETNASALKEKKAEPKIMSVINNERRSSSEEREKISKSFDETYSDLPMNDIDEGYDKKEKRVDKRRTGAKLEEEDMRNLIKLGAKETKTVKLEKSQAESENNHVIMDKVDNKFDEMEKEENGGKEKSKMEDTLFVKKSTNRGKENEHEEEVEENNGNKKDGVWSDDEVITDYSKSEEELIKENKVRDIPTEHKGVLQNYRERRKPIRVKSNSDVNKSATDWELKHLAKYVKFESVIPLKYSSKFKVADRVYDAIVKDVQKLRKVIKMHTEEDSRIMVNAMVIPLCKEFNLQLETEQTTKCTYLPTCRFDYKLLNDNKVIGCIETKRKSTMNSKALVQAILQLYMMQAEGIDELQSKENIAEKSFFNILTDGIRFVFMRINGKHLELEYTDADQLLVQDANSESEIKTVLRAIVSLLKNESKYTAT